MSKPISTSSLKTLILTSKKPQYHINVLLRTLPYTIKQETKRLNPNMKIIKDLTNKYKMVQKISTEVI